MCTGLPMTYYTLLKNNTIDIEQLAVEIDYPVHKLYALLVAEEKPF